MNRRRVPCSSLTPEAGARYAPRQSEHYTGTISKLGVDVGYTDSGVLIWDVVAASSDVKPGALEGGYGGVTVGATVGVGASANALFGGFENSVALQPISVEGNKAWT